MKVSVAQLNAYVKQTLASDVVLSEITVSGEISGLKYHSSGHIYFTLKDESAAIRCAFFKPHSLNVRFALKDGMKILATGRVTLYERDGQYQLNVFSVENDGLGDLYAKFEALKKKLEAEGLFDASNKKALPKFAKKIGVATSPTGAVIRDIINVATRRCPNISIVLAPVNVQGEDAPRSICAGVKALDDMADVDVIIVGRGGGSVEDLWCFNDEEVAKTIFACNKPVISAVGHETDFTIADFVADLRAPTPSAAAELAVFNYYDTVNDIDYFYNILARGVKGKLSEYNLRLIRLEQEIENPEYLLQKHNARLEVLLNRLSVGAQKEKQEFALETLIGKLDALNPLKVLKRGFSVATDIDGKNVKSVKNVSVGDKIRVRVDDGSFLSEVTEI